MTSPANTSDRETGTVERLVAEMQAGLEGLPEGPWRHSPWHIEESADAVRVKAGWILCTTSGSKSAAHIARCSPDNIAALLSELTRLKARADAETELKEHARRCCDEAEAKLATAREALEAAKSDAKAYRGEISARVLDQIDAALRLITEGADHERS